MPAAIPEVPLAKQQEYADYIGYNQTITLDNVVRQFGLQKSETVPKNGAPASEHVGWRDPDQGNWYHSNMFDLEIFLLQ